MKTPNLLLQKQVCFEDSLTQQQQTKLEGHKTVAWLNTVTAVHFVNIDQPLAFEKHRKLADYFLPVRLISPGIILVCSACGVIKTVRFRLRT